MSGRDKIRRKRRRTKSDSSISNVSFVDETCYQKRLRIAESYLDQLDRWSSSDSSNCLGFLWRKVEKSFMVKFSGDNLSPMSLAVSQKGFSYTTNVRGALVKWSMETGLKVACLPFVKRGIISCVAISLDNRFVAVGDSTGSIQIWAPDIIKRFEVLKGHKEVVTCLKFRYDSCVLYSGGGDTVANIWNMNKMCLVKRLRGHTAPIISIDTLLTDVLLTGSCDNRLIVWKISDKTILIYKEHKSAIFAVKFIDDEYFISGDASGKLMVWSVNHKESLCRQELAHGCNSHTNQRHAIYSITYIQDEELIASGSDNDYIILWKFDVSLRTISCTHRIHIVGFVNALVVTRCGSCLVAAIGLENLYGPLKCRDGATNCVFVTPVCEFK